jgi:hypothetical protein
MTEMQIARIETDTERARRLLEYVKGELRNMYVGCRMDFTVDLFVYLQPELKELLREKRIQPVE